MMNQMMWMMGKGGKGKGGWGGHFHFPIAFAFPLAVHPLAVVQRRTAASHIDCLQSTWLRVGGHNVELNDITLLWPAANTVVEVAEDFLTLEIDEAPAALPNTL